MKLYRASDRKQLYHHIFVYKQRREEYRKKHGFEKGKTVSEEYKKSVCRLNKKIKYWTKMISKIDSNNNKLLAISNALIYYTGVNVKRSALGTSARYRMARYIFYKYCLEHNLSATLVADFVGASRGDVAARARLKFTKSFAKSPKNRELYMGFCSYIKELAGDTL